MSRFAVVPTVWLRHPDLSTTDKAVLTALATYASAERYSFPSVRAIADDLQLSERTVQYALRTLEGIGAIQVERRSDDNGRCTSNGYRIIGYDLVQGAVQSTAYTPVQPSASTPVQPIAPKQYQYEQDQKEDPTTPTTTAARLVFKNPEMQLAYQEHRYAARNGKAFDAALSALLTGMTTGKPVAEEVLGLALMDMAANGEAFNASRVRGYIRKHEAAQAMERPGASTTPPSKRWTFTDEERAKVLAEMEAEERQAQLARGVA